NLAVTAAITAPSGTAGGNPGVWNTLSLRSGGTIGATGSGFLTVTNLALQGAGGVSFTDQTHVTQLAGSTAGALFFFEAGVVFQTNITVGEVDNVSGISTNGGGVFLENDGAAAIIVNKPIMADGIGLDANRVTINAAINAGAGDIQILPF